MFHTTTLALHTLSAPPRIAFFVFMLIKSAFRYMFIIQYSCSRARAPPRGYMFAPQLKKAAN